MTVAYWLVGRRIVESEQKGEIRAEYGDELIERLAADQPVSHRHDAVHRTRRRPLGRIDDIGNVPENVIVMDIQTAARSLCLFRHGFSLDDDFSCHDCWPGFLVFLHEV
jgi:hypothetical protein